LEIGEIGGGRPLANFAASLTEPSAESAKLSPKLPSEEFAESYAVV